ncbi:hypothetical protein CR983_01395 [Candidatus Saccharibacteria bacterium]|nr:MAG: hypothetical protein CR983_01395 [Candidatus Saccharibacteria bacterium]
MTLITTQKVIKIGSSRGVTLPAKELARLGIKEGDKLQISCELVKSTPKAKALKQYKSLKKQCNKALKNLANR